MNKLQVCSVILKKIPKTTTTNVDNNEFLQLVVYKDLKVTFLFNLSVVTHLTSRFGCSVSRKIKATGKNPKEASQNGRLNSREN